MGCGKNHCLQTRKALSELGELVRSEKRRMGGNLGVPKNVCRFKKRVEKDRLVMPTASQQNRGGKKVHVTVLPPTGAGSWRATRRTIALKRAKVRLCSEEGDKGEKEEPQWGGGLVCRQPVTESFSGPKTRQTARKNPNVLQWSAIAW